ncbi:MAG: NAD(+)--dinitrogen-reductase ADP-D-ribosyltransferase [Thermodesulfovibrionales bacterium]|jgi:NAD+--dinitrogen-reductase ADP-D-ribosyltransferase
MREATRLEAEERERGHSSNLVGVPTGLLAGIAYNEHPVPLRIAGVREMYQSLFEMLNQAETHEEAVGVFQGYMGAVFGLDEEQREKDTPADRRRFRSSYLKLLSGWSFDSNWPQGAVLKGWVESRFGLFPTFHKEPIKRILGPAWMTYIEEKMSSRFHNNSIYTQLDLLYEFCQWSLGRFFAVGLRHMTLYRGICGFDEEQLIRKIDNRTVILRMNSLVSFSSDRDLAGQFGDSIIEAEVPLTKILFFNRLIPQAPLQGEAEYMVIGGDYLVQVSYF